MSFVWDALAGEQHAAWEFEMRFFFRYEIEHLVARSPLRLVAIHGDFGGGPLARDSREYVVRLPTRYLRLGDPPCTTRS